MTWTKDKGVQCRRTPFLLAKRGGYPLSFQTYAEISIKEVSDARSQRWLIGFYQNDNRLTIASRIV